MPLFSALISVVVDREIFQAFEMSTSLKSDDGFSFDLDHLLPIVATCKERLEMDVKSLSEAHLKDLKYTQELEGELRNCSKKIGYLQDQLNLRNIEANCLGEHVHSLELKLAEVGKLQEKLSQLNEEVIKVNLDRLFLMRELENKEVELQNSTLCIEKLEEAISSIAMESQCEIESIKLDLLSMEQMSLETKKFLEERNVGNTTMDGSIEDLRVRLRDSQKMIECLEKENKKLKEKLEISESKDLVLLLENKERLRYDAQSSIRLEFELPPSIETCTCEEVLGSHVSKPAVVASDENLKVEMEKMLNQIHEYKLLVKQLKDDLREEKSRSKEEAEDLTQEMAELRYQIMGMLEEECKRRSCIEQASLQRIAELEEQVRKEKRKSFIAARKLHQLQKLAESRSMGVHHLSEDLCTGPQRNEICSCGECENSRCTLTDGSNGEPLEVEYVEEDFTGDCTCCPGPLAWIPEENRATERENKL